MNSRERMQAAMELTAPDRVPVMCQFSIGHMLLQLETSPPEFWCDAGAFVDGLFRMRDIYDFDGILVSLHGHDPDWRTRIASRRTTAQGEEIVWIDGSRTIFPSDELPQHFPSGAPDVSGAGEVSTGEHEPLPDYIPVSQGLRFTIDPNHRFDALEAAVRRSAGRYSIHGEITSPFDYILDREGHQAILLALIDNPDAVHRSMAAYTRKIACLATEMAKTGVDAIKISSPFAGAGFISPDCYTTFVLPYEREIVRAIQANGVKAYIHTCGRIRDRIELMIASGTNGIECLDPPPLGNIELKEALEVISGRCFVKGNVDSVNVLLRGSRSDVVSDVRARLETARTTRGFILSTACSIAPRAPREHVMILREAVEATGSTHL